MKKKKLKKKIDDALLIAEYFSHYKSADYKDWVILEIVKSLIGADYDKWIKEKKMKHLEKIKKWN